jgi:release factor glutamine methyltransferase
MTAAEALRRDPSIARNEVLLLLARASGRSRESLLASPDDVLTSEAEAIFRKLRDRRLAGEPIAYLLGEREFYGRRFAVDPAVLIPRPETELLIDLALGCAWRSVLDLGTGSGVIAITLALERSDATVTGTDVSREALRVAAANAHALRAAVAWRAGSWFDALDDGATSFDLIVSNPPYIAAHDLHLDEGDLRFEPSTALTDGADGLAAIRIIVAGSSARLNPAGTLLIEHGHDQAAHVRALFEASGLAGIASIRDLAGIERVTVGRRAP